MIMAVLAPTIGLAGKAYAIHNGFTPGYWKQPHHFEDWVPTGYETDDKFNDVFGVTRADDPTLLQALRKGGGGEFALGRHAVAALLNATHGGFVGPDEADVVTGVQAAYASGDFEWMKDIMEPWNEKPDPW